MPSSPGYTRKKIFMKEGSPASKVTAGFNQRSLEESTVESYEMPSMPSVDERVEEPKMVVAMGRRGKTTKENALCLRPSERPFKKNPRSLETIPSTQNEIMPENNESVLCMGKGQESRLQVS